MRTYNNNKYKGVSRFENIRPTVTNTSIPKRKLESTNENNRDIKKRRLNPYKQFHKKFNVLIELLNIDNGIKDMTYILNINNKQFIHVNSTIEPEYLLTMLNGIYKNRKHIQLNLIINNKNSDFTQTFNKFKHLTIVKCLLSDIIVSPQYSIFNIKSKTENISQLINLLYTLKFNKKDEKFIEVFKKILISKEENNNPDLIELDFANEIKEPDINSVVNSYRKQLINIVKVQEQVAENKINKLIEKRKQLELKKEKRLLKKKVKITTKLENKVEPVEQPENIQAKEKSEQNIAPIPKKQDKSNDITSDVESKEKTSSKAESEEIPTEIKNEIVVPLQDIFKCSLLTVTKTISSLTTTKKLKPYKIVKSYIKLPIKLYDNTSLNELIDNSKYSTNIIVLSYINVSVSDSYFINELNINPLPGNYEREFKVLSIGGGINDSLRTLADIKKDLMIKIKTFSK